MLLTILMLVIAVLSSIAGLIFVAADNTKGAVACICLALFATSMYAFLKEALK